MEKGAYVEEMIQPLHKYFIPSHKLDQMGRVVRRIPVNPSDR